MRSAFYIDGFNLYHAVDKLNMPPLKWLNLWALAEKLRFSREEQLAAVYYFSAYADWLPAAKQRHQIYVEAIEAQNVAVILGRFKEQKRECKACGTQWKKHEEKETDVNLALQVISDAYEDKFDRAYIISADSDMIPAMRMVRAKFPRKEIIAVFPPMADKNGNITRARWTGDIKKNASAVKSITLENLQQSLLPLSIKNAAGKNIDCPIKWRQS